MEYNMRMYGGGPGYGGGHCDFPGCRPVSNLSCYTVPEHSILDGGEEYDESSQVPSTSTTDDDVAANDAGTPIPTPAAIGTYHPPDGGPSQLGYFVPISPVFFRSPQFRKRDTIDSNRSRRSTSYCGTSTPTPSTVPINNTVASSRRSSLISAASGNHGPSSLYSHTAGHQQQQQPPPIPQLPSKISSSANHPSLLLVASGDSKFAVSNNNFNNSTVSNGSSGTSSNHNNHNNQSATDGRDANTSGASTGRQLVLPPSTKRLQKSESAAYSYFNPKRFSSPPFGDLLGGTTDRRLNLKNKTASLFRSKSKKEQRTYGHRSMNETIEVLADQVVEDEKVVSAI
uniref:Uncharacterized protein n=1 Tax=Anopheles albimanus TaxID=7167 RepID=A0A182F7Q3_ANOAL